ncbi:MAG: hypothetical protein IPM26_01325 [Saprospiraceae bacterium]|nr:hypothetical protein [Saprospiraceae bacterium]
MKNLIPSDTEMRASFAQRTLNPDPVLWTKVQQDIRKNKAKSGLRLSAQVKMAAIWILPAAVLGILIINLIKPYTIQSDTAANLKIEKTETINQPEVTDGHEEVLSENPKVTTISALSKNREVKLTSVQNKSASELFAETDLTNKSDKVEYELAPDYSSQSIEPVVSSAISESSIAMKDSENGQNRISYLGKLRKTVLNPTALLAEVEKDVDPGLLHKAFRSLHQGAGNIIATVSHRNRYEE